MSVNINSTVEVSPLDLTRLLYMLYIDMDSMIRHADTKAQIVLGVNTIIAATTTSIVPQIGRGLAVTNPSVTMRAAAVLLAIVLVCILASIFAALSVTVPRVGESRGTNLFFFGNINAMDRAEYEARFLAMTLQDVKQNVIDQIYSRSRIVQQKFRGVRLSMMFLFAAIAFWSVMIVLVAGVS